MGTPGKSMLLSYAVGGAGGDHECYFTNVCQKLATRKPDSVVTPSRKRCLTPFLAVLGMVVFFVFHPSLTLSAPPALPVARIDHMEVMTLIRLVGNARQQGLDQGKLLSAEVRSNIAALIDPERVALWGWSRPALGEAVKKIRPLWPEWLREEMAGLSEGARIPLEEIELAHVLPPHTWSAEAVAALRSRTVGGVLWHAHALHFPDSAKSRSSAPSRWVVRYHPGDQSGIHSCVALSIPGYLGCLTGMNERGLSVSVIPSTKAKPDQLFSAHPAVPATMLARLGLHQSGNLAKFVNFVQDQSRLDSAALLIGDGRTPDARVVEFVGTNDRVFGVGDAAESRAPFQPMADVVCRTGLLLAPTLATSQRSTYDPRDTPFLKEPWARHQHLRQCWNAKSPLAPPKSQLVTATQEGLPLAEFLEKWHPPGAATNRTLQMVWNATLREIWLGKPGELRGISWEQFSLSPAPVVSATRSMPGAEVERQQRQRCTPKNRTADASMPEIYRLDTNTFEAEQEPFQVVGGMMRYTVRFPSPMVTPHPENNTVHGEYFRPLGSGPFRCVLVLHIAGGDFELSRFLCRVLAQNGVAAFFIKMPYYGERRPIGKKVRMISADLDVGLASMRQVVLDLRRACDWIEQQPELKHDRIGILGISLGSITGSLASAIDPRISHACLVMGGASLEHVMWESSEREAREYRKLWTDAGGTRESFAKVFAPYDPVTYGERLRQRVVLMISASEDRVIPRPSTMALWNAAGKQRIIWYPCGHYTIARHILQVLGNVSAFFREWPEQKNNRHDGTPPPVDTGTKSGPRG